MLEEGQKKRLIRAQADLGSDDQRRRFRAWRDVLHLYEDVVRRRRKLTDEGEDIVLFEKAREAFTALGGIAEPVLKSLQHYDSESYGPFLGVSDEGRVADRIRDAFLQSPKSEAWGKPDPLVVGCSVDAERLGGAGEVPVGPFEYRDIQLACLGRVLTTTNVGTRMNARYYNDPPNFIVYQRKADRALKSAIARASGLFAPFWRTPNAIPRPVTLFVDFGRYVSGQTRAAVLQGLRKEMQSGGICDPKIHCLGVKVRALRGDLGIEMVRKALDLAAKSGVSEVAVDGVMRKEAQERVSMPDLLNFFDKKAANQLWEKAKANGILLRAWKTIDVDSVARNTWTSLQTAHNCGLYLGKYGMLPLTLAEADFVIGKIQSWFRDWTAAPAVYVDCPTVAESRCFDEEAGEAVRVWLKVLHKHKVPVVLIDTADKSKGRRLLKDGPRDEIGILSEQQIKQLDAYARKLGIKALWAGGITASQAYRFGKMGVFGIYTTTSTDSKVAVSGDYARDPSMADEKEPTFRGVSRVVLLLQAGFLEQKLDGLGDAEKSGEIRRLATRLTEAVEVAEADPGGDQIMLEHKLSRLLLQVWHGTFKANPGAH